MNCKLDTHFARAIRKYGKENFIIELIDTAETQDELNRKERYWIRFYDSIHHGYNETDAVCKCGGNTYMSKNKREMRRIGKKIRDSKLGALNPHSRSVKCLNEGTGEELFFDTVKECQEYFGEDTHRFITTRVNHQTGSLYLTEWNIAYSDEPYGELEEHVNKRGTEILVTDLHTNECFKYASVRMASQELNIPRSKIYDGIRKYNGHFILRNYKFDIFD